MFVILRAMSKRFAPEDYLNFKEQTYYGTARKHGIAFGSADNGAKQQALKDISSERKVLRRATTFKKSEFFSGENKHFIDTYTVTAERLSTYSPSNSHLLFPQVEQIYI